MNVERLTKLVYLMRNLKTEFPNSNLDLSIWITSNKSKCGTVACACGYAAMWKHFKDEEFKIDRYKNNDVPTYKGYKGWTAIRTFFEISENISLWLFNIECYYINPTPEIVATRIEAILNGTADINNFSFGFDT